MSDTKKINIAVPIIIIILIELSSIFNMPAKILELLGINNSSSFFAAMIIISIIYDGFVVVEVDFV